MAYAMRRSMNGNLAEGMSDGKYKKIDTAERGGTVEPGTYNARRDLDDTWYGLHEARDKVLGDGTMHVTPDFVVNPRAVLI